MKTCCLRVSDMVACDQRGVEPHRFLNHLVQVNIQQRIYKIFGYMGKQVCDHIHVRDVTNFIKTFIANPRCGEVYNIGGGRNNSCSILEAFSIVEGITGLKMRYEYVDRPRAGDHICYISNLNKTRTHYPNWNITAPLHRIFDEIVQGWTMQSKKEAA